MYSRNCFIVESTSEFFDSETVALILTTCVYIHQSTFIQMDNSNPFYFFYGKKPLFLCMCAHSCFSFYRKWPTADLAKKYYRCTYIVFRYDYKRIWKFIKVPFKSCSHGSIASRHVGVHQSCYQNSKQPSQAKEFVLLLKTKKYSYSWKS